MELRGIGAIICCSIASHDGFVVEVFGNPVIPEIPRSDPCLGDGTVLKIALLLGIGSVHNTFRRGSENTS